LSLNRTTRVELQRGFFALSAFLRRKRRIFGSGMNALDVLVGLWMNWQTRGMKADVAGA